MDSSASNSSSAFLRGVLLVGGGFAVFFAGEFALEYYRAGFPGMSELSWSGVNNTKLVDSLSPIARAYNNVLAMLIATVGLAIPLTANMHTPTLIDLFLKDRINRVVLVLMAFGAANVLFVLYAIGPGFAPMWAYRVAVFGALIGWAVLIPYFFYVVRFLDPHTIIGRMKQDAVKVVEAAGSDGSDPERAQDAIQERMFQIGTIVIKAIDRADRSVMRDGIWAIKRILDHYGDVKPKMHDAWFEVKREDFVGMSHHALTLMTEKRTWIEMQALHQLLLCYQHALNKAPDSISAIANVVRKIAQSAFDRDDRHAVSLCVRAFNSFLREGINRGDGGAVFDVMYQYRQLASDLSDDHNMVQRISGLVLTYTNHAYDQGYPEIAHLAAFDLEKIVERAYESENKNADEMLEDLLAVPSSYRERTQDMVVKAKLVAAGYFAERGMSAQLAKVHGSFEGIPASALRRAAEDLVGVEKRQFYEITDRAINIEWTSPTRRKHIEAFAASLPQSSSSP